MRFFVLTAALFLASGARAQDAAEFLDGLMAVAEFEAMEEGMSLVHGMEVGSYEGFTSMHEVELQAGVEYLVVVVTDIVGELDPDVYVEDPEVEPLAAGEGEGTEEKVRFTAPVSGTYTLSVELYGCETDDCAYGIAVFAAE